MQVICARLLELDVLRPRRSSADEVGCGPDHGRGL